MIRQAKREDKREIAQLSYVIWKDMELSIVEQFSEEKVLAWLEQAISDVKYRNHYEHVNVYEVEGKVAGIIIAYKGHEELALEENWHKLDLPDQVIEMGTPLPIQEAKSDELYIETVSVFPEYRGRGIATQLMRHLIENADSDKLSLSCDYENKGAFKLYQKLGFETEGTKDLYGHLYRHMVIHKKNAEQ